MAVKNFVYIYFIATLIFNTCEVNTLLSPSYRIEASEAPFMVYISNGRHYCGGVILSDRIVLTASHCVSNDYMMITAGLSEKYVQDNAQKVRVVKTLPHEDYVLDPNGIQAYYDLGLVLLRTPFTFNQYVQKIDWANVTMGEPATLVGWGSTDAWINMPSDYLRKKNITLVDADTCKDMLSKAVTKCGKQEYEICAVKSACNGDSGSPLVQKVGGVTKLVGITSWLADDNINCDTSPTVFENVGYFSDWIKEGMRTLMKAEIVIENENEDDQENIVHWN